MEDDLEALQSRFWYRVDDLLTKKGKTLQEMAEATNIKYPTILSWRARKRLPDLMSALNIAEFFGVTIEYLLEIRDKKTDLVREFDEICLNSTQEFKDWVAPKEADIRKLLEETGDLISNLHISSLLGEEKNDK